MTEAMLKKYLHYDRDSGVFTWIKQSGTIKIGNIAGTVHPSGHIYIKIKGKKYKAHRLAWLYEYGILPGADLDHINRIPSDNKISNLREVTTAENAKNRNISKRNTSGVTGVYFRRNRWNSEITVEYKKVYLGSFIDFHEAVNARRNAEVLYGFTNE